MNKIESSTWSTSHFTNAGVALLVMSLGAACGSSDSGSSGGDDSDDGGHSDGGASSDGGHPTDGHASVDGSGLVDGGDAASTPVVNLRTAGNFVVLAMSGIATVPTSAITGDIGVSPMAAIGITGFPLTMDSTGIFSTTPQVTGKVYASDYTPPTPSNLTTAISDMQLAFTDAAGRAPNVTELGAGSIGGLTLRAGVYEWSSGLDIPTNVTLTGSSTDVWIFQIAQNLTMSSATEIVLAGGAVAKNVFWQVSGDVSLGTTAQFEGTILCQTAITLATGASIDGRLLAQTAVNLDSNAVVAPAP